MVFIYADPNNIRTLVNILYNTCFAGCKYFYTVKQNCWYNLKK